MTGNLPVSQVVGGSPSTSPVCPNGTGNALTTSGCVTGSLPSGGTAGTQPFNLTETPSGGVQGAAAWALPGLPGRTVTGSTDTITEADRQHTVTYNYASAVAVTLTSAATLGSNISFAVQNIGAGAATFTPGAGTINGGATLVVSQGQNCAVSSPDNTNYIARCASGQVTGSGGVTATPSAYGTALSLTNTATTVNGQTCTLGSTCTVTAAPNAAINLAASGAGGVTGQLPIGQVGSAGLSASGGVSITSTGAISLSAIPLSALANQAADTIVQNATGGSAAPTAVAAPSGGTNGCAGTTDTPTYNSSTHAWGCHQITGGGATATYWRVPWQGNTASTFLYNGGSTANQIAGQAFVPDIGVTFSNIYILINTADATGNYGAAIATTGGTLLCHNTTGVHLPSANIVTAFPCSEGSVTLTAGTTYILLTTADSATGKYDGPPIYQILGPYQANTNIVGCSSSAGVLSGTCTIPSITTPMPYSNTPPTFILH